jgi:hypothetical protein
MQQKSTIPSNIQTPQTRFSTFDPRYFSRIMATSEPITDEWRRWIADSKFAGIDDHIIGVWKKLKQKMDERHIKRCPNIGHEKSKH